MKTIKFRGKRIDNGEWVYGYFVGTTDSVAIIIPFNKVNYDVGHIGESECCYCFPETIGQFTGLYDKNGNEIYEGDIVRVYVALNDYVEEIEEQFWRVGIIRFTRGQFALTQCTNYGDKEMITPHRWSPGKKALCTYPAYRSEIIGNIHDNPELLKEELY